MSYCGHMRHPIPLRRRDSVQTLRQALAQSDDAEQKTRIRAIINIQEGVKRTRVAEHFVISRTTLLSWVVAYNKGGIVALKMSKGGRPEGNPKWNTKMFGALAKEIDKGGRYWSVPLMQQWIKKKYKKHIPETTVWYHVTSLDYSYKSARPHPYQGDTAQQEVFKKGASPASFTH
jgi:transposase